MNQKLLTWVAVVLGIVLIVIAIVYWVEPAKSLPSFFPAHESGSNHHHVKHGIAAFLLGAACLVFAWFRSGPRADELLRALSPFKATLAEREQGRLFVVDVPLPAHRDPTRVLQAIETFLRERGEGATRVDLDGHSYLLEPR